ncbi:unnamed protein product [Agarophyton chilense]
MRNSSILLECCPEEEGLLEKLKQRERDLWTRDMDRVRSCVRIAQGESNSNAITTQAPPALDKEKSQNFSLDEFVRLVIFIHEEDIARKAMKRAVGSPLERRELDDRASRDDILVMVENRFNDTTLLNRADFSTVIENIESSRASPAHKSSALLKGHYQEARNDFTFFYEKYNDDTELVHLSSKVIGDDVGYDTGVNGEEGDEISRGAPFRKKRCRSNDSILLEDKIEKLVNITTSLVMVSQRQKTGFDGSNTQNRLEIVRAEIKCHSLQSEADNAEVTDMKDFVEKTSSKLFRKMKDNINKMLDEEVYQSFINDKLLIYVLLGCGQLAYMLVRMRRHL